MRILISGGCKNGKSSLAELWIGQTWSKAPEKPLYYLATMIPSDQEDRERIARHRVQRSHLNFKTLEIGRQIDQVLPQCDPEGFFLLDSLTALLANEMFAAEQIDPHGGQRVSKSLRQLTNHLENLIIVSDYIYSDAVFYDPHTELYRQELAKLDRQAAAACDIVVEVAAGQTIIHKGKELLPIGV